MHPCVSSLFDALLSPPSLSPSLSLLPLSLPFLQTVEAESLAAFDKTMATLAAWCEEYGEGAQEMPKVAQIIAVKQDGSWMRAKVARQVSNRYVGWVWAWLEGAFPLSPRWASPPALPAGAPPTPPPAAGQGG